MICRQLLTLILLLVFVGCSDDVPLPPAQPLSAAPDTIARLYGASRGDLGVSVVKGIALPATQVGRDMEINLYFPEQAGSYPLILFSHGNWSDNNSYDRVIEHWVSHGYTVIAPNHLDCCSMAQGIFMSLRHGQFGLVAARTSDLHYLLDAIPALEALVPTFRGKTDKGPVAIAGHSFGAFTAQQFGGAAALDPDSGDYPVNLDARVAAVVALSPPGPMFDTITEDSWRKLTVPTLISTGTWDIQPAFWPDWQDHLISFETAVPGDKYALVTQGADHYLGNLICRPEREAIPQEDALKMVKIATTAFLDAQLKQKKDARALIESDRLREDSEGFAEIRRRPVSAEPLRASARKPGNWQMER